MIQVILFDFGSTLIYAKEAWEEFFQRADHAMQDVLHNEGFDLVNNGLCSGYHTFIDCYYALDNPQNTTEWTAFSLLSELLAEKGYQDIPSPILRKALNALYAVTNQNWYPEDDALTTLESLKDAGYRLGMISNTSDDLHVQDLIDQHKFRTYFEFIITSAGFGIRKPDKRIFQAALDHFQVTPQAAVMVGDTLGTDVVGANEMGIFSIWITRHATHNNSEIIPRVSVNKLEEIPALLKLIEQENGEMSSRL